MPPPLRQKYADFGQSIGLDNILLIGDSNIEGSGDSFANREYNYSMGHFIHKNGGYDLL